MWDNKLVIKLIEAPLLQKKDYLLKKWAWLYIVAVYQGAYYNYDYVPPMT